MTKYIANENGDWWAYVEGEDLYVVDDESEHFKQLMLEHDTSPEADKFEKFIWQYGKAVNIKEVI
jgi:hypothetical protein